MTTPAAFLAIALACLQVLAAPPRIAIVSFTGDAADSGRISDLRLWQVRLDDEPAVIPRAGFDAEKVIELDQLHGARPDIVVATETDLSTPSGYAVSFHTVTNDWTAERILRGQAASVIAEFDGTLLLRLIDLEGRTTHSRLAAGATQFTPIGHEFEYVRPLEPTGHFHLVTHGPDAAFHIYDAPADTLIPLATPEPLEIDDQTAVLISPDGSKLAVHDFNDKLPLLQTAAEIGIRCRLQLIDLETQSAREVSTVVFGSSGNRWYIIGADLAFEPDNVVTFDSGHENPHLGARALRRYRMDPATGEVTNAEPRPADEQIRRFTSVPEHLKELLDDPANPHAFDVVWAYFVHRGLVEGRYITWPGLNFTFMGQTRFLMHTTDPAFREHIYLADMDADTLTKIPCPPELQESGSFSFWILPDH